MLDKSGLLPARVYTDLTTENGGPRLQRGLPFLSQKSDLESQLLED